MPNRRHPPVPDVCIHGHFYQPPRENPWTGVIEPQPSAAPYRDWNERITDECYRPNAAARLVDGDGQTLEVLNNYAYMSFNFGPTLLSWLEQHARDAYTAILDADRVSCRANGGHGNALAQPYNHIIMPLASGRDQRTQVVWGIRDFVHRFSRAPEGMWLPETAVDIPTLEALADHDIRFTILAPHQAHQVRPLGATGWEETSAEALDTSVPYLHHLPSGRQISIFFYHGPMARAVAFEGILSNGEQFAQRLVASPTTNRSLVHIATDGESYGHHHRLGEMSLAYALRHLQAQGLARITNYAAFLADVPPQHEVRIAPNTSWSCAHGIERWRSDCGCSISGQSDWSQAWRTGLRLALDWLRDQLGDLFEAHAGPLLRNPWAARDNYIDLVLDPTPAHIAGFFATHALASSQVSVDDTAAMLALLETQRMAMLMYTSCGWFFDDVAGIESVQCLQYAARAVELTRTTTGIDLEPALLERLRCARSNDPTQGDAARLFLMQAYRASAVGQADTA